MSLRRLNLAQIFLSAIVTLVVTVGSGFMLNYFLTREPLLVYSSSEPFFFSGKEGSMGIYSISVINEGRKATKNVIFYFSISPAEIEQWDITADPALQYVESIANSTLTLTIPSLNPKEKVQISLLCTHLLELSAIPEISIRAEDIMGIEKKEENIIDFYPTIFIALAGSFAGLLVVYKLFSSTHEPDSEQNKILAYLFGNYGLEKEMNDYYSRTTKVAYWSEADRLGILAKSSSEENKNKIKSILKDLLEYANIGDDSKGIVYYNIARIEAFQNNEGEMQRNLREAKKLIPKLLKKRLKIDPIFKNMPQEKLNLE